MDNLNHRSELMVPWGDDSLYPPRAYSSPAVFSGCYRHDSDILPQTKQRLRSLRFPETASVSLQREVEQRIEYGIDVQHL
jgi:hypothetical protein